MSSVPTEAPRGAVAATLALLALSAAPEAHAASVERVPASVELEKDVVVPAGANGTEQTSYERKRLAQLRARTALKGLDAAVRWQLPAAADCAARAGLAGPQQAALTLRFGGDGVVKSARAEGGPPPLLACLTGTFEGRSLPALLDGAPTLNWTVRLDAAPLPGPDRVAEGSAAPAATASAYVPLDPAGSARLDLDVGLAGVAFGDLPDAHDDLQLQRSSGDLRFYQREGDQGARFFGVTPSGVSYVAAPEVGVFAAVVFVADPNGAYQVRDAVRARYGTLRLDPVLDTSYARGAQHVVEVRPFGEGGVAVTLLDLSRGAATGAYGRVPGDPVGPGTDGRRLPRIFADDAAQ
jgi:hypothetical protein